MRKSLDWQSGGETALADWKNGRVPLGMLAFAVIAVLLMILSVTGGAVVFLPWQTKKQAGDNDVDRPGTICITGSATIAFLENGLPSGTSWSVTVTGVGTKSSTSYEISFIVQMDTTYDYSVASELGSVPSPSSGSVYSGPQCNIADVYITYSAPYTLTFVESSSYQLPSGTQWSATFNGKTQSTTSTSAQFGAFDGTWSYSVGSYPNYTQTPSSGSVTINGGSKTIQISFTADAVFNETGLPNGTSWSIDINGLHNQSSTSQSIYIPETSGTYSYNVDCSNSKYVAVPSAGQFTMSGNVPDFIGAAFLNNSTVVGAINRAFAYYMPNWSYSSINASSYSYMVNLTAGYFDSSARGTAILNNTTYSLTFNKTEFNSTNISHDQSFLTLVNSTSSGNWNNQTILNDTLISMARNDSSQLTTLSTVDYRNSTVTSELTGESPIYANSSAIYFFNATATVVSSGTVNFSFTQHLPTSNVSGYLVATDPGDEILFDTGVMGGTIQNGTKTENISTNVSNNNGTLISDSNVTTYALHTSTHKENSWWGYAKMGVVNITLPSLADLIGVGAFGTAFGIVTASLSLILSGAAAVALSAIAIIITPVIFDFGVQMGLHNTTNNNYILYLEGGYTNSSMFGLAGTSWNDPYVEMGFYSDGYMSLNGVYHVNPNREWYYYPFANIYEGLLAQGLESPHQSAFPSPDSGWVAW